MTETKVSSFAELAKLLGSEVKADNTLNRSAFSQVIGKVGRKAAMIWAVLQENEACRKYGKPGEILHKPSDLSELTGYDESTVIGACVALLRNGYARYSPAGFIKAA